MSWNASELVARLKQRDQEVRAAAIDALQAQGERWLELGNKSIPRDTDALMHSGAIAVDEANMTVAVGWGAGLTRDYAIIQHEDTGLHHPGGGTSKWGELAARNVAASAGREIAAEIKTRTGG